MDYKFLKSGSDIRGTADDSLGEVVNLDKRAICTIVDAFIFWMIQKKQMQGQLNNQKLKIAVGYDSRNTSKLLKEYVTIALQYSGCNIFDCELASTPAMFMMTTLPEIACDGAIMITASHMPKDKNGLKFFIQNGGITSKDIDNILELAAQGKSIEGKDGSSYTKKDFLGIYCDYLINKAKQLSSNNLPYTGLKIVLDASNGVGGFFSNRVLQFLGADISGSQFLEPNGDFPNHIPNPEDKKAMDSLTQCVLKHQADLGIIFDTDADRVAFVDKDGKQINKNRLIALISVILLQEEPKGYIVTDSTTSEGLTQFITQLQGRHHRYKRGYNNVITEAKRFLDANMNALVAIETSGHAALKENYFLDDGAYLAIRVIDTLAKLKKQNKTLGDLIATLQEPQESVECRIKIKNPDFLSFGQSILKAMEEWAKREFEIYGINYEGIRVKVKSINGWFLARMSLHEPVIVLNIETNEQGGVKAIAQMLYNKLSLIQDIDASSLMQMIA